MIKNKICINCGSSSFVSDRSLGGKIVCARCGSSSLKNKSYFSVSNKKFILILVGIIFLVIILL